ncbi:uncharacterized protein LOC129917023 [Episyrphus balteatus]|uniref:uncharacterized protein LOC129917023 n=1 Tax=Episyrphus balteatus TaxID=286459 RepID=UPI0024869173|nr:uncharacterized protein LOC129917023 [Episyrphus balteatus]XP_055853301.1 uncharacterized protein LOC129917023 [Episyrphus balteatus]XP_055853302.1 uncharacterized protein LOC129917023 [Episyrphus balteatus]
MSCGLQAMCNNNNNSLHLAMMDQDPKDLEAAQLIIEELRAKCRFQTEHIMKWKKAYAIQIQQHYRYQKEKTEQMNGLTSQLLLLESRLKRKQKQIAGIICHRELTILRQQKIIDTLSSRLVDHGLDTLDPSYTDFDSLNDSDSAVVLEDIDSDCNSSFSMRRKGSCGDVTVVRSISDAIETNMNKYGGARRSNCFLRRPDILETVYSVEEDPEPQQTDVAEKRDKFKNRSEKAVLVSSLEGQLDEASKQGHHTKDTSSSSGILPTTASSAAKACRSDSSDNNSINAAATSSSSSGATNSAGYNVNGVKQSQVTNFNRVMSNHRSVTKPKDVKYKRINKAKSKSLEELRGRLKHWVERGSVMDPTGIGGLTDNMPQTAQSYA